MLRKEKNLLKLRELVHNQLKIENRMKRASINNSYNNLFNNLVDDVNTESHINLHSHPNQTAVSRIQPNLGTNKSVQPASAPDAQD